jgi:hypothetical protein
MTPHDAKWLEVWRLLGDLERSRRNGRADPGTEAAATPATRPTAQATARDGRQRRVLARCHAGEIPQSCEAAGRRPAMTEPREAAREALVPLFGGSEGPEAA